jgi:hypothetical protein
MNDDPDDLNRYDQSQSSRSKYEGSTTDEYGFDKNSTDKSKDAAATVAGTAKEAVQATYAAVSAQASALASNVADELTHVGEDQKKRGAQAMTSFAAAVKRAAGDLTGESPVLARQLSAAAEKVESLSESLRTHSVTDLFKEATDLARRQPVAFFAGSLVAGFALARFLKSSAASAAPAVTEPKPAAAPERLHQY